MSDSDGHDPFLILEGSVLNRQIMLVSAGTLSLVMLLVISAYLYARCVHITNQSRRTQRLTLTLHLRHTDHHPHIEFEPPTIGLDPSIIAALPVFNVKDVGVNNVTECAVCLSSLEDEEMAKLLPNCKHYFHVGCIDTWLASHSTCPLCRAMVQPLLQPQLREGPIALSLDAAHLLVQVLPVVESSQGTSDGGGVGAEPSKMDGSTSRLSSFRSVLSRARSSRRILQLSSHDGVGRDLERQ